MHHNMHEKFNGCNEIGPASPVRKTETDPVVSLIHAILFFMRKNFIPTTAIGELHSLQLLAFRIKEGPIKAEKNTIGK